MRNYTDISMYIFYSTVILITSGHFCNVLAGCVEDSYCMPPMIPVPVTGSRKIQSICYAVYRQTGSVNNKG